MSDEATAWARNMGRALNLKTATRFVLLTLANDAGTKDAGFVAYQAALAADTGMSLSALKSHLSILRKAQLVIAGDPRMVQHIPRPERPCVYRLNYWIPVEDARRFLAEGVDNSGQSDESGQPESGGRRNPAIQTPESSGIPDSQNLATQTPGLHRLGSQNPATNPLRGLYGGRNAPRRVNNSKTKTDDGKRLCMECTVRRPLALMVQKDTGGFICESHLTAS